MHWTKTLAIFYWEGVEQRVKVICNLWAEKTDLTFGGYFYSFSSHFRAEQEDTYVQSPSIISQQWRITPDMTWFDIYNMHFIIVTDLWINAGIASLQKAAHFKHQTDPPCFSMTFI